jgi:hypothetical protein
MASCGVFCGGGADKPLIWLEAKPEPAEGDLLELDESEAGENMDDVTDSDSVGESGKDKGSLSERQDGG